METVHVERLKEPAPDVQNPERHPSALSTYLGHAAQRGMSEEAQYARQALQESVDLREQGYTE